MKKLFAIITCLFIAMSSWALETSIDGIRYDLNTNTTEATVIRDSNNPYSGSIIIPQKVVYDNKTYSVTSIGLMAFYNCTGLTSVTIPSSVTSINSYAFEGCSKLISITIPNSVTSIGGGAFQNCTGLTSITIPNSVTSIGSGTFCYCYGLTSITIPNSVTSIGGSAFQNCTGLTSVTIPNSVTSIGSWAFQSCTKLTSITLPNSVTSIGNYAFRYCYSLTSITIPNSVTSIEESTFESCWDLTSVDIPNSVTSIGKNAFYGCYVLTSITIPYLVTSIGDNAFGNCNKLKDLTCLASEVPTLGSNVFDGYGETLSKRVLYVPNKSVAAYKTASQWKDWPTIIGIKQTQNLTDGVEYTNNKEMTLDELTFTKTFSTSAAGEWNAFYVPMSINVNAYASQLDFAKIYAFCATVDTNGDGTVDGDDENYLFVRPVKTGVLKPNVPYLVRPREAKTYVINSADNKLYPKTDGKVEFSTSRDNFTVTGLNAPFTVTAGDNNYYVSESGTLGYRTSGSTTVKANRWIMHRESKGYGSVNVSPTANSCRIIAIGEDMDETTAIETIKMLNEGNTSNSSVYTLDGRKANDVKTLSNGIYIKNGKKFIVK